MGTTKAVATTSHQKAVSAYPQKTIQDELSAASVYVRSGILPTRYTKPEAVVAAMHIALELGLKPLISLRQIAVIKGTPSLFGDLPLALVQASGMLAHHREYLIDEDGHEICVKNKNLKAKVFGAVCEVMRKGETQITERYFTMEQAKAASLLGSDAWAKYPQRMLGYRARSAAIKDKFADCLNGLAIAEYDHDVIIDHNTGEIVGGDPDLQKIAFGEKEQPKVDNSEIVDADVDAAPESEAIQEAKDPTIYYGDEDEQLKLFEHLRKINIANQYWLTIHKNLIGKNKANQLNRVIYESSKSENP